MPRPLPALLAGLLLPLAACGGQEVERRSPVIEIQEEKEKSEKIRN
jgi:hypothetical protein